MEQNIYKYSDQYFDQQRKLTIYLMGGILLVLAVVMLFTVGINKITFLILVPNVIIFVIVMYIFLKFWIASMKSLEIHLTPHGIERKRGGTTETFLYKDIKKITVKSNRSGEPKFIQVKLSKRMFELVGFEDIDGLIAQLKEKVSQDVIRQKTMLLDWSNPVIGITFFLIAMIGAYLGLNLLQHFTNLDINKIIAVLFLLLGIEYIYLKPLSRRGVCTQKYDIALGIVFMLMGLVKVLGR